MVIYIIIRENNSKLEKWDPIWNYTERFIKSLNEFLKGVSPIASMDGKFAKASVGGLAGSNRNFRFNRTLPG